MERPFHDSSERKLAAAFVEGEGSSFDRLVLHYRDVLYTLAYRLTGDRTRALNMVRELFVRWYFHLLDAPPDSGIRTDAYRRIVRLSRRGAFRTSPRGSPLATAVLSSELASVGVASPPPTREDQIQWVLSRLSAKERELLVLQDVMGLSPAQAAGVMKSPVRSIDARTEAARRRFVSVARGGTMLATTDGNDSRLEHADDVRSYLSSLPWLTLPWYFSATLRQSMTDAIANRQRRRRRMTAAAVVVIVLLLLTFVLF